MFLLNNDFIATNKPNTKRKKNTFILYAYDYPPLNSRVENKASFEFVLYVRVDGVNLKHYTKYTKIYKYTVFVLRNKH